MDQFVKKDLRILMKAKLNKIVKSKELIAQKKLLENLKERLVYFSSNWQLQYKELPIIGLYLPLDHEPDVLEIMEMGLGRICFPVIKNQVNSMMEYSIFTGTRQQLPKGHFLQTQSDAVYCLPDVVLVPGLAFDRSGVRLGRGNGYFDIYFAGHECAKIALCYTWQLMSALPSDVHDRRMDIIVTEDEVIKLTNCDFL